MIEQMTRAEAMDILTLYRNWNEGQTSVSLAISGKRTLEDDVLDERRQLLRVAMARLQQAGLTEPR